jgi:hypothetical protein
MNSEFGEVLSYLKEIKEKEVPGWEKEWEIAARIYKNGERIANEIYIDILSGIADSLIKRADSEWSVIVGFNDNDGSFRRLSLENKELQKYFCVLIYKKVWEGKGLYITLENDLYGHGPNNWFFGLKKGIRKDELTGQKVFEMQAFRNEVLVKLRTAGYVVKEENMWYYAWKYASNQKYQYRNWNTEEFLISAISNRNNVIQGYVDELVILMNLFEK